MAYLTSNPPRLINPSIGSDVQGWVYKSTHTSTEVLAAGFFSNGSDLGMRVADLMTVINSTSGVRYDVGVSSVNASSAATVVASTAT